MLKNGLFLFLKISIFHHLLILKILAFGLKNNSEENKIAAIGIKVKKWIAYHGFSININVNKSDYRGIVPCGISNKGIINISDLRAKSQMMKELITQ